MIKKIFLFLAIVLPICILVSLCLLDKNYFLCPIEYKWGVVIRSDQHGDGVFGADRSGNRLHEGIDLFAKIGTPVLASRSGVVVSAKENRGMGKYVILRHLNGMTTVYGHLSKIFVKKHQFVRQGHIIGEVGKTGNANYRNIQPHLHFEVKLKGVPQDPLKYLEYKGP